MRLALAAAAALVAVGCGAGRTQPRASDGSTGELRIRELHVLGAPFAIEGEYTYVRVGAAEQVLTDQPELRFTLPAGRYTVEVWHRTCDGNCGNLDPPSDRCEADVSVEADLTALATIHNNPGLGCRIVLGRVGIAYAESQDFQRRKGAIWFSASDGTHAERLSTGAQLIDPALSPDGRRIAFVRFRGRSPAADVLVVPTSGGSPTVIRRSGGFVSGLVWSPESGRIVAVENEGLVLIDLASRRARLFAKVGGRRSLAGVASPTFSPGGGEIAYLRSTRAGGDIYVYDVRRRTTRRITRDRRSSTPVWGSQGIAFNHGFGQNGDVWTIPFPGRDAKRLTRTRAGIFPVAWSEDGTRLLAENPAMHNGRLWAVESPSGTARRLTDWVGDLFGQDLSTDGQTVLAAIGCGGFAGPRGKIETIPFGGGEPRVILEGPCRATWNE